jgi:hypothetical protein
MSKYSIVFLLFALVSVVSCGKDDETKVDCTGITPTYNNGVRAIMESSCATVGCHVGQFPGGGIDLSTYATVKSASLNGKVLQSIKHESGADAMPQGAAKLPNDVIKIVECWIQNGAPE